MCHFISAISKKIIDVSELDELRKEIRVTMCQLEVCFPPSFFDTMEHYMIYLADQIFVLGPSYMHYMYSYERHMVVMKGYVHNRAHPEGSLIEGYTTEEIITIEDSASSILCLPSSLDAILWRRERDGVIGWTNERAIDRSTIYSRHRCIFEEMPRSWGTHTSNLQ
jgi:hypothetical protein